MGQTCPMINISPKHLAKPQSLLGSLTLGLKKMPRRPLCIKYSYLANSHTVTFNCWALSYKTYSDFAVTTATTTITGGTKPSLAAIFISSGAPLLLPKTSSRQGLHHIHRFTQKTATARSLPTMQLWKVGEASDTERSVWHPHKH